jgi:hypothetical protein
MKKIKEKQTEQEIIFKVVLSETKPIIWRRLKLSSKMTLDALSLSILGAFDWSCGHMHQFNFGNEKLYSSNDWGSKKDNLGFSVPKDSRKFLLSKLLKPKHKPFVYEYDFGDSWCHIVTIESISPTESPIKVPECLAGENCAPPEDCGGTPGFENFKEIMASKKHSEYSSMKDWNGGDYNPLFLI